MALGASRADVSRMVLFEGLRLTAAGLVIGLAGAVILTSSATSFSHQLFGTRALDGVTFVSVTALLALVALLASYIPAWRASKVQPVIALRNE